MKKHCTSFPRYGQISSWLQLPVIMQLELYIYLALQETPIDIEKSTLSVIGQLSIFALCRHLRGGGSKSVFRFCLGLWIDENASFDNNHAARACVLLWRKWSGYRKQVNDLAGPLTLYPPNYSIWIFTHLKLCLADAIHNFKGVKIIKIWQNGGQLFSNLAGWCHILSLTYLKCGTWCANKKWKPEYMRHRRLKG